MAHKRCTNLGSLWHIQYDDDTLGMEDLEEHEVMSLFFFFSSLELSDTKVHEP